MIIEELGQAAPGDAAEQETVVEVNRGRLAKPAHLRLTRRLRLAKRGAGDLVHPGCDAAALGRVGGLGVGVDVPGVQPESQPVRGRFRRLPLAVVAGLHVAIECPALLLIKHLAVNQNLGKRPLVVAASRPPVPLGVGAECDVFRLGQVTKPLAVVCAALAAVALGRFAVGEVGPRLAVGRGHGVVRFAVSHVCRVINIVVAQPAADGLQTESRGLAGDAFFQLLRQARQFCLGLADLFLQAGALVVDQCLLVCAIIPRRQRAADLEAVSA